MYRLGKRQNKHLKLWIAGGLGLLVAVVVGVKADHYLDRVSTQVAPAAAAVSTTIASPTQQTKSFVEPDFSFTLPSDWIETAHSSLGIGQFSFQNTATYPGQKQLTIFEDHIPPNFAVNRYLAITVEGSQLAPLGSVSDNCIDFTQPSAVNPLTKTVAAKWQGVNFICDAGNYERDVVGAGTAAAVNTTTVTGPVSGTHSYFFVYVDNADQPDYSIFSDALASFVAR